MDQVTGDPTLNHSFGACINCNNSVNSLQAVTIMAQNGKIYCDGCKIIEYIDCVECNKTYHFSQIQYDPRNETYICGICLPLVTCLTCGQVHDSFQDIVSGSWCLSCIVDITGNADVVTTVCGVCNMRYMEEMIVVDAKDADGQRGQIPVCPNCAPRTAICGCGYLRPDMAIMLRDVNNINCCEGCTIVDHLTGQEVYNDPNYMPAGLIIGE